MSRASGWRKFFPTKEILILSKGDVHATAKNTDRSGTANVYTSHQNGELWYI